MVRKSNILYPVEGIFLLITIIGYSILRLRYWTWRDSMTLLSLVFTSLSVSLYALPDDFKIKNCSVVYKASGNLYYLSEAFVLFSFALRLWVLSKSEKLSHRIPFFARYIVLVGSIFMMFFLPIAYNETVTTVVGSVKTKSVPTCLRFIPQWFFIVHLAVGLVLHSLNTACYLILIFAKERTPEIKSISSPKATRFTSAFPSYSRNKSPSSVISSASSSLKDVSPLFRRTIILTTFFLLISLILFTVVLTFELTNTVMISLTAFQSTVNATSLALPFILTRIITRKGSSAMFHKDQGKEVDAYIGNDELSIASSKRFIGYRKSQEIDF